MYLRGLNIPGLKVARSLGDYSGGGPGSMLPTGSTTVTGNPATDALDYAIEQGGDVLNLINQAQQSQTLNAAQQQFLQINASLVQQGKQPITWAAFSGQGGATTAYDPMTMLLIFGLFLFLVMRRA